MRKEIKLQIVGSDNPSSNQASTKRWKKLVSVNFPLIMLALPAVIYFLVFHYIPMFGVVLAFKDYKYSDGILGSAWVGLKNFEYFFTSQDAWRISRNTVGYGIVFIILGNAAAITVALLLYEIRSKWALKVYQTSMILPRFLSWVLVGYISYAILNPTMGALNQVLHGLGFTTFDWYADAKYWPFFLVAADIWKHVGLNSIIFYAALMGIDPELYEAARIDGASRWKQMKHISLPSIIPVVTIIALLAIGNVFRGDFGLFYQIPRDIGVLYPTTDIIDTYVYRGLRQGDFGITAAVGLFQSIVGLMLVFGSNWLVRKTRPENALF